MSNSKALPHHGCFHLASLYIVGSLRDPSTMAPYMATENAKPKFSYFPDLDCWITTINKRLTCGQHAGTFSHLCGPSKPPFNPSPAMMSVKQGALQAPQQAVFDSNFHKVLTNSGTSTHMWNCQCDFISHWMLTQEEQMCDKVLGISSTTVLPLGSGTIWIKVEDNLNIVHTWHLHDARHLPNPLPHIFFHNYSYNNVCQREICQPHAKSQLLASIWNAHQMKVKQAQNMCH